MAHQCARVVQRVDTAKEDGSGRLGEIQSIHVSNYTCLNTRVYTKRGTVSGVYNVQGAACLVCSI